MISRFFRVFFWAILLSSIFSWIYLGIVSATARQAIIVLHRKRGMPDLVAPGESQFFPGRIFPGRVEIHPVDIGPRMLVVDYKKGLYQTEMLGLDDSFYIRFKFRFRYTLQPEKLPDLFLKMEGLDWKALEPYLQLRLSEMLTKRLLVIFPADNDLGQVPRRLNDYFNGPALEEMKSILGPEGIEIQNLVVENIYVPDAGRYTAILGGGQGILNQKLERIRKRDEALARRDAESLTDEATYARLETIGKLLIRYPGLKDYLAVDRLGSDVKVMVMPYERWFNSGRPTADSLLDKEEPAATQNGKRGPRFENLTPP
ncbi:MAG: hypothetical protein K1X70_20360 [Leptospirales bacterium]|nr:hypothetical protein [Leptospirales bacterium]HNJ03971.1 hypothetical protein [Leptospiraceae bacterium]HNL02036.1 hypothetical protein [Leptospiraceae bacterium]HNL68796.1 hypothetical protein [Leptospiraceae bacterium]HNN60382.1 hypothetical protein [Leptospiraceae bacterium]